VRTGVVLFILVPVEFLDKYSELFSYVTQVVKGGIESLAYQLGFCRALFREPGSFDEEIIVAFRKTAIFTPEVADCQEHDDEKQ